LNDSKHTLEHWLFSGPIPYQFAQNRKIIEPNEGVYVRLHGSSLFSTLLEAKFKENKIIKRISLDTISQGELNEVKDSYAIKNIKLHRLELKENTSRLELIKFHQDLYNSGQTEVALTCIRSVYEGLKKRKVPVYRVMLSELSIHTGLEHLREQAYTREFERKQFAILGIKVIYDEKFDQPSLSLSYMRKELSLNQYLIDFVEKIKGTLMHVGKGLFYIYTTKGEIELFEKYHTFMKHVEDLEIASDLSLKVGIGYGDTVIEASDHLQIALNHTLENEDTSATIIDENGNFIEYLTNGAHAQYQFRSSLDKLGDELAETSFNTTRLKKIEFISRFYRTDKVSSKQLSIWLNVSERYARTILTEMVKTGLAKEIGEKKNGRGRPKKIYKLKFH
jgi:hypothetical protein